MAIGRQLKRGNINIVKNSKNKNYRVNAPSAMSVYQIRSAATKWLSSDNLNVFVTVTLKSFLRDARGFPVYMNQVEAEKTARIVRDRILKKLRSLAGVSEADVPFLIFFEKGSSGDQFHFHIVSAIPDRLTLKDYDDMFRATVGHLHWVNKEMDFRSITYCGGEDWQGVCFYSLKSGFDAFLPSASYIPKFSERQVS